jgi:capsular exopolysaccharide synthesis family protein
VRETSRPMDREIVVLNDPSRESFFDLRRYILVVRNRRWLILAVAALVAGGALLYALVGRHHYQATSQIVVPPIVIETGPQTAEGLSLETEAAIVRSTQVARLARELMDSSESAESLLPHVSVSIPPDTQSLLISYTDPDPEIAQRGANAFARAFLEVREDQAADEVARLSASYLEDIRELEEDLAEVNQTMAESPPFSAEWREAKSLRYLIQEEIGGIRARSALLRGTDIDPGQVIVQASRPSTPSGPGPVLVTVSGLLLGLFLGLVIAFLRDRVDQRLRGRIDVQATARAPVLAVIPDQPGWTDESSASLISVAEPDSPAAEAYRTLGAGLMILNRRLERASGGEQTTPILLIVSPLQGEGKTTTAANLGVELSQAGTRVLLISADLRNPRLHAFFDVSNDRGLSSMLTGDGEGWPAIGAMDPGDLSVIPSGPAIARPAEALQSSRMLALLEEARARADLIVIDAPPLLMVADSLVLASYVDGVLLVVDGQRTRRAALLQARGALDQIGANVLGVVLNNVDPSKVGADYASYGYYGPAPSQQPPLAAGLDGFVDSHGATLQSLDVPATSRGTRNNG